MRFATLSFALISLTQALKVRFDTVYDKSAASLATVACSDGSNGLLTRNFTTFGSLPSFPRIGGAPAVTGFNDPDCGSCWSLTFVNGQGISKTINILAIDVSKPDFTISESGMNELTGNQAIQLGTAPITAARVPASKCGLQRNSIPNSTHPSLYEIKNLGVNLEFACPSITTYVDVADQ